MINHLFKKYTTAALIVAVVCLPAWSADQRLTLSERVDKLEGTQGGNQLVVDLVTQIDQLKTEIAELRGLLEQQDYELERLKSQQKDQYLDLDARITQLGTTQPVNSKYSVHTNQSNTTSVTNIAPPEVATVIDAGVQTQGINNSIGQPDVSIIEADPIEEKRSYEEAFADLKSGNYAESARKFSAFVDRYPDSELADNAQYWLGESYYVTRNYKIALDVFQSFLNRYPESSKLPDTLLKLGFTFFELKDWDQSRKYLQEVVDRYPGTTVERLAKTRLKSLRAQ
ncbi:MAG: tol-pal system protein YbgF [bacterium]